MLSAEKQLIKSSNLSTLAKVILTILLIIPTIEVSTARTKIVPICVDPINLGPIVNSPVEDSGPCISADGLSLYLQSRRSGGLGENDIWVTMRRSKTMDSLLCIVIEEYYS